MGFNLKVCEWILLVVRIFYHLQIMQLQFYCRRNFRSSNGIFPFVCTNLPASALPSGRGRFLTYSHGKWLPCEQGYIMICPHGTSVRIERYFLWPQPLPDCRWEILAGLTCHLFLWHTNNKGSNRWDLKLRSLHRRNEFFSIYMKIFYVLLKYVSKIQLNPHVCIIFCHENELEKINPC